MLFLLSPAKKLDYDSPLATSLHSDPLFVDQAAVLIDILKEKDKEEIARLMSLSPVLTDLNVERYEKWSARFNLCNARPAALAFNGDVYDGLLANELSEKDLQWAQDHLAILSGLYGVLRPLDLMQPYRLEMGTRLANPHGRNLYDYWRNTIAPYLNERLARQSNPVVINLASDEYFKAIDLKQLKAQVVQCVFQDEKSGQWRVVGFHAKRARGLMARYAIKSRATQVGALTGFDEEGYAYAKEESTPEKLVFRRPENWKESA